MSETLPARTVECAAMSSQQAAVLALGRMLRAQGYRFTAPTPLTYQRVLSRPRLLGADPLVEAFGWNRPFAADTLGEPYLRLLEQGEFLGAAAQGEQRSLVRFSTLDGRLFAHSSFPTDQPDAIFFGPDTYRFVHALRWIAGHDLGFRPRAMIDVGTGSGAGGICAAAIFPSLETIILSDISPRALEFAQANAALNEVAIAECKVSDVLAGVERRADLIVSNPPYLVDRSHRAYRHGGGGWGCALAVRIVEQALDKLTGDGRLLLYTGSPIVQGTDKFLEAVQPLLQRRTRAYRYEETDPDVFGEELDHAPYDRADRIATVVLHVKASDLQR